jgi:long-chain fatty acid transport protein
MNARMSNTVILSMAALLLGSTQVHAAGFYLSEVGTPGSVGTAGVANPTNTFTADASWTNPAGMTGMHEDSMLVGGMVAIPKVEFNSKDATAGGSDGGNAGEASYIPSIFYTRVLSGRSRLGLSLVAPFGGGLDYGDNFVGRYAVQNVSLSGVAITPSYAYQVNDRLSLGGGVSVIYTQLDQDIAIMRPFSLPDGQAKFRDLDDWGYQPILGATYQFSDQTLAGLVYRGEMDVDLKGDLSVSLPVPKQEVKISWDNPQTLEGGVRHKLNDRQTVFFNLGWEDWSAFSNNELSVTNTGIADVTDRKWDDTWHAGVAYAQNLGGGVGHFYTLGLSYESSPVEDKYRTFDFPVDDLWKLAGSYAWQGSKKLDFAVGATLYLVGDASIDQTEQGVRTTGKFDNNMTLFLGGTLRYVF